MMRLMHVRTSEFFGGPERLILGQVKTMSNMESICCSIVRGVDTNRFLVECNLLGIDTCAIRERFTGDVSVVGKLRHAIDEFRVQAVVSHDYKSNVYCYLALRRMSIRQIAYFHGLTYEDFKVRIYHLVDQFVLARIPHIVTVSNHTKKRLVNLGIQPESIAVVYNAIDAGSCRRKEESAADNKQKEVVITFAGRLSYEKGVDLLIGAVAKLQDISVRFRIDLYGSGPEEQRLRRLSTELGTTEKVKFCGQVDNVLDIFRSSDMLVLPSRTEGMPVVILEAWSQQLGVLASCVGGIPEMITDGQDGILVEPEDIDRLTDALRFAITHVSEMDDFGRKGQQTLLQRFTLHQQAEILTELYAN